MMNILDLKSDNTFHFLELNKTENNGTIRTWVYSPQSGWHQKFDAYFPCFTGFGARPRIEDLAKDCVNFINSKNESLVKFEELANQYLITV